MVIEINTKFPIEWNKTYYLVTNEKIEIYKKCDVCNDTGLTNIEDEKSYCPKCVVDFFGYNPDIIDIKIKNELLKFCLYNISIEENDIRLIFKDITNEHSYSFFTFYKEDFNTMINNDGYQLFDNYNDAVEKINELAKK